MDDDEFARLHSNVSEKKAECFHLSFSALEDRLDFNVFSVRFPGLSRQWGRAGAVQRDRHGMRRRVRAGT